MASPFAPWAEINDDKDLPTLERFRDATLVGSRQAYAEHMVEELEGETALKALPDWRCDIMRIDYEAVVNEMETSGNVRCADHPGDVWVFDGRE